MGKSALILGAASAVVVIACGAGGAIYALNASNSDNTQNKTANYELQKEQAKLNGWNQKDGAWYYYKDDKVQTGWVQDNGSWYYLDDSGKMKLNWIQDKNKWYYLGSDGKLRTGWIKDNDKWYYMNSDGTMAVNTTVDGTYINENGLIEDIPKSQNRESTDNNSNKNLSVEEARNLIFKNIDIEDRTLLINGEANFLTSVTPNTNDDKAKKIYNYLGTKENMYEFQGLHSAFFVCQVTGTTYIVDPGETGKMGCGIYRIKDGHRAETWRIGGWHDKSHVAQTYNGEDWMTIG